MATLFEYVDGIPRRCGYQFLVDSVTGPLMPFTSCPCNASLCRFCGTRMDVLSEKRPESMFGWYNMLYLCKRCGWWNGEGAEVIDQGRNYGVIRNALVLGVLREYDTSSLDLPIGLLRAELARRPHLAYETNPTTWEKLVGDVLADVMKCRVTHVGRTADGGIDLLVIDGDTPAAVQVKRRSRPKAKERVTVVREMLGAILLKGFRRAAVITTAAGFTKPAIEAAATAEALRLADRFELIDFDKFLNLMRTTTPRQRNRWKPYVHTDWMGRKGM